MLVPVKFRLCADSWDVSQWEQEEWTQERKLLYYVACCAHSHLDSNNADFFLHRYGFSPAINSYSAFGFSCTGSESSLSQCSEPGAVCSTDNANFAIAIECGGQTSPSELCACNIGLSY